MKLPHRRQFLHLAAGSAALPAVSRIARAQTYPTRPVRIVVPFPAGGPSDFHARLIGQWLSENLSQPFVVENRPGAAGNLGTEVVVRAPPDGHTLILLSSSNAINQTFYEKLNFNLVTDLAPVAGITRNAFVMVVTSTFPAKDVPAFIAYAKANPSKISMASSGVGTSAHLCGELFKMMTGTDMFNVPYRGEAPAVTDVISGQIQVMFVSLGGSLPTIRSGKLRALAVTTTTRSGALPEVAAMSDFVPGYEFSSWSGIGAPRKTPISIIEKLNAAINAALASPGIKAQYDDLGATTLAVSPAEFGKLIAAQTEQFAKLIKAAGIKPQ